ncbi:hypothetical protein A3759_21350 [Thalassolituus sp. HI0120]|nr:hypothetical protein A3759_21350 [Thalassolituus sp. HI0120]
MRIRRLALEPGQHQLTLDSTLEYGLHHREQKNIDLKSGEIHLWQVRSLAPVAGAPSSAVKSLVQTGN